MKRKVTLDELRHALVPSSPRCGRARRGRRAPILEHERPGADRMRLVGLDGLGVNHDRIAPAEPIDEQTGGVLELDHRRQWVGRLDACDRLEELLLRIGGIGRPGAVERKLDDRGIERRAIMEFHAGMQLERIAQTVRRHRPFGREQGLDLAVLVDRDQALVEVAPGDFADRDGRRDRRIETRWLDRHPDDQRVFGRRQRRSRQERQRCNRQSPTHSPLAHFWFPSFRAERRICEAVKYSNLIEPAYQPDLDVPTTGKAHANLVLGKCRRTRRSPAPPARNFPARARPSADHRAGRHLLKAETIGRNIKLSNYLIAFSAAVRKVGAAKMPSPLVPT